MVSNHIPKYGKKYHIQNPIWGACVVRIKKYDPKKIDIPSFQHGNVHVYKWVSGEYLGCCGMNYFLTCIKGA